jgi:hypothetical protein
MIELLQALAVITGVGMIATFIICAYTQPGDQNDRGC